MPFPTPEGYGYALSKTFTGRRRNPKLRERHRSSRAQDGRRSLKPRLRSSPRGSPRAIESSTTVTEEPCSIQSITRRLTRAGAKRWTTHDTLPIRAPVPAFREVDTAQVAQLVEHATENRSVGGSIPPLGTTVTLLTKSRPVRLADSSAWRRACQSLFCRNAMTSTDIPLTARTDRRVP